MSTYTDYDSVSQTYDNDRYADGVEMMTMMLSALLKKDISEIKLLEAGCGTGNYSLGFVEQGIGKVTLIDASEGMLGKAKAKVTRNEKQVEEIKQVFLPILPYKDDSFDAITFIQVLHHLDSHFKNGDEKRTYPNLCKALTEAYRVLKPGGVLLIDTSFRQNLSALPFALLPSALEFQQASFIHEEDLMHKIKEAKFKNLQYIVRPDSSYLRDDGIENILNPAWRKNESGWVDAESRTGFEPLLKMLQEKKDNGTLKAFEHEFFRKRRLVGNHTTLFALKCM